jgi:outer membrane protein assembly factor BamB
MNSGFRAAAGRIALVSAATAALVAGLLAGTAGAAPQRSSATRVGQGVPVPGPAHPVVTGGSYSDWTMFRGDPGHSGISPETAISTATAGSLTAGWTATLGTSSYISPVVATSAALGEAVVFDGANSHFYAYPAAGGSPLWSFKTGKGGGSIDSSPVVYDGVVYFASSVGVVYALNADTGALLCSYATNGLVQAAAVVVPDPDGSGPVLYVGTDPPPGAGTEYAIYGAGNTHGSCSLDWQFNGWQVADSGSWSSPAYGTDANGNPILVFGSVGPDDALYALNATTGALDWRYQTATADYWDVGAAPTISAPGQNGFADGVAYVTGKDKIVYAIDLTTGKLIWSYKLLKGTNADVSGTALDGNTLYLGSDDGVWALNATTGKLVWQALAGFTFYASPVITGPAGQQVLVIGNNEGRLYALSLVDGSTVWTARPTTVGFWASPAVSQGGFYDVDLDGVLRSYFP